MGSFFVFKQETAYEVRISDWSADVCSSDLGGQSKLAIAEIGIAFLLFLVGLELHPRRLWALRKAIFGLGLAQVVVTGLILTALILVTLGFSWQAALVLGLPLALSSTAQVLPSLKSSGRINSPFGEKAFSDRKSTRLNSSH